MDLPLVLFNEDGSGIITAPTGAVIAFAAGITPGDLLATSQAFIAANPAPVAPPAPQPITVTVQVPPVTVNAPDVSALQTHVGQLFVYLPQLQQAVSKIPGAVAVPIAPTPS